MNVICIVLDLLFAKRTFSLHAITPDIVRTRCPLTGYGAMLLLFALVYSADAHNGQHAIAIPVTGIVVDGDLSDWPEDMRRYSIAQLQWFKAPQGTDDLHGVFRAGYNEAENALYIAVEVADESVVVDTIGTVGWIFTDGATLGLDLTHPTESEQFGAYEVKGDVRQAFGEGVDIGDVAVEIRRTAQGHQYEWRVDIARKSGANVQLRPGMVLGLSLDLRDKDRDDSFSLVGWGTNNGLSGIHNSGDLILGAQSDPIGRVQGRLIWDNGQGVARAPIKFIDEDGAWSLVDTDRQGRYTIDLPTGTYRLEPEMRLVSGDGVVVEIGKGQSIAAPDLIAQRPTGTVVPVGDPIPKPVQSRIVRAGPGKWHGSWQTLSVSDGMPDPSVISIYQDRDHALWFGTLSGVVRYDGVEFETFELTGAKKQIPAIVQDRRGAMWFGSRDFYGGGGLVRLQDREYTVFSAEDVLPWDQVTALHEDRQGQLWIGTDSGVAHYGGESEHFVHYTTADGLINDYVFAIIEDRAGRLWFATAGGVSRYDGAYFTSYTAEDGLDNEFIRSLHEDGEGGIWAVMRWLGATKFDGEGFAGRIDMEDWVAYNMNDLLEDRRGQKWLATDMGVGRIGPGGERAWFAAADGLADNKSFSLYEDHAGDIWVGTGTWNPGGERRGGGISRYVGETLTAFAEESPLAGGHIMAMARDSRGRMWFGGTGQADVFYYERGALVPLDGINGFIWAIAEDGEGQIWFANINGGLYRYDGNDWVLFTVADGLVSNAVYDVIVARDGGIWCTTVGGVSRYDGEKFQSFTRIGGLLADDTDGLLQDSQGHLWFGHRGGVSRYDGSEFVHFTAADGVPDAMISTIFEDSRGLLWFGSKGDGIARYDGRKFTRLGLAEGLPHGFIEDIIEDARGHLWISSAGGGLIRYDGKVFQALNRRDGLPHDAVHASHEDDEGRIWIGTQAGLVRFSPDETPPAIHLKNVTADREYGPLTEIDLSSEQDLLAFEFRGSSFKSRPSQLAYVYRLAGKDEDWQSTRAERVFYSDLPVGEYIFEVKAVDRDLVRSTAPATVRVLMRPAYGLFALWGSLGLALVGLVLAGGYALRQRRAQLAAERALMQELEDELQTARQLQMGLMPKQSPEIAGLDIAGRCETVNHVGGDFFQYFERDGKLSLCLADVTGHAMEAAVPVMMFSGVLNSQMEEGHEVETLFGRLNGTLCETLDARTFVCFALGELALGSRRLRLANGGCPYPYHFRAATGEVVELEVDAYPLGVRAGAAYGVLEVGLESSDYIVFCSDGIIEAADIDGEMYGFERTAAAIRAGCAEGLAAGALIERLIGEVQVFAQGVSQEDDMTCVVLRVG